MHAWPLVRKSIQLVSNICANIVVKIKRRAFIGLVLSMALHEVLMFLFSSMYQILP